MNGRLYDPKLHRFLQTDNYVQDPGNTQNYNRYGYVLNNPLKYTDPSGWLTEKEEKEKAQKAEEERMKAGKSMADWYAQHSGIGADGLTNQQWMNLGGAGVNSSMYNSYVNQNRDGFNSGLNGIRNGSLSIIQTDYYWITAYKDRQTGEFVESHSKFVRTVIDVVQTRLDVAEVGISLKQLRMIDAREAMTVNDKLGTFGKFSSKYTRYSKAGKILGKINNIATAYNRFSDVRDYNNGSLSGARLSYRLGSTVAKIGTSAVVGTEFGGPWGTIAGFLVGLGTSAGEIIYDGWNNTVMPVINQGTYYINNNHGYSNFHP